MRLPERLSRGAGTKDYLVVVVFEWMLGQGLTDAASRRPKIRFGIRCGADPSLTNPLQKKCVLSLCRRNRYSAYQQR